MILKFCLVVYLMFWWRDDNNLIIGNELINWLIIRILFIFWFYKFYCIEKLMRLFIGYVMMRLLLIGVVVLNDIDCLIIS